MASRGRGASRSNVQGWRSDVGNQSVAAADNQVWKKFTCVPYKKNLLKSITKIETALAKVHMVGLDTKQSVFVVTIMEKITKKWLDMMERLLGDMNNLSDSSILLDNLRELTNHKQLQKLAEASVQSFVALAKTPALLTHGSSCQLSSWFKRKKVV